jgi:hypothetical protein
MFLVPCPKQTVYVRISKHRPDCSTFPPRVTIICPGVILVPENGRPGVCPICKTKVCLERVQKSALSH